MPWLPTRIFQRHQLLRGGGTIPMMSPRRRFTEAVTKTTVFTAIVQRQRVWRSTATTTRAISTATRTTARTVAIPVPRWQHVFDMFFRSNDSSSSSLFRSFSLFVGSTPIASPMTLLSLSLGRQHSTHPALATVPGISIFASASTTATPTPTTVGPIWSVSANATPAWDSVSFWWKAADSNSKNDDDNKNNNNNNQTTSDETPKLPRGFEDFFSPRLKRSPPFPPTADSSSSSSSSKSASAAKEKEDLHVASSSSPLSSSASNSSVNNNNSDSQNQKKDKNKKKQQSKQTPPPPPPLQDEISNVPGLLALLIAIFAVRSVLEDAAAPAGSNATEITFVDFRNAALWPGYVERIIVVNQKWAKVILKRDAPSRLNLSSNNHHNGNNNNNNTNLHMTAPSSRLHGNVDPGETPLEFMDMSATNRDVELLMHSHTSTVQQQQQQQHQQPSYYFFIGSVESFEERLSKAQAHIHPAEWVEVQYTTQTNWTLEGIKLLPLLAFVAAVYFGSRGLVGVGGSFGRGSGSGSSGGGGLGGIFGIGRSTAKKIQKEDVNVTFDDVAGCQQAKLEVMEFVDFLKDASRFTKLGAKIPKGALLCGPPGTGKTLLAKAVAGEAGVPFYSISGSDFIEMFVGVGPSRVRDLFKTARENAPCIVFIDEIDAVGRQRGRGAFSGGGNDERENTLNQLLVEMDGFSPTTGVVVLAGTNRVDILDQALTRPGRFDRQILVDRPDLQGRKEIFLVHLQNIKLDTGNPEDFAGRLAGLTPGFAGADIANMCNEAAIVAARRKGVSVTLDDFEKAVDRIIGGLESNKILSVEDRSIVAHHEAGHAVAGWFLEHADPLLKLTIIPRTSGALGFAQYLPKEVFLRSRDQILDIICMALAGRAAEQVFFGRVTTGASDDLRRVTQLAYSTIKDFGMNSTVGPLAYPREENDFGGEGSKRYSDWTAQVMDDEARAMVDQAYQRTLHLIEQHKDDVAKVAALLLERETMTHDDMVDLIGPRPFVGDSVYNEFVSKRHRPHNDKNSNPNETASTISNEKDNDGTSIEREADLTPGLA